MMKTTALSVFFLLAGLTACTHDLENAKPEYVGDHVEKIILSPNSYDLYVDSDMPQIKGICLPSNAPDSTLTWTSDHPEVLTVNEKGQLAFGTVRNSVVTITAATPSGVQATCKVTVRNVLNKYHYIDAVEATGLWILDRNLGATKFYEGGEDNDYGKYVGDIYLYGYNEIVANRDHGGPDGKGGDCYVNGRGPIRGGYPTWIDSWKAEGELYKDWSIAENVPGLEGWRLPTKAECEKIAYATNPENFKGSVAKGKATVLRRKLGIVNNGMNTTAGIWNNPNAYLWTSDYDASTKKVWCLTCLGAINPDAPLSVTELPITHSGSAGAMGLPIRLVRSADAALEE